jgi:hypothetical protein
MLLGDELAQVSTELLVLLGFAGVLIPLAVIALRFALRRALEEGSLLHY